MTNGLPDFDRLRRHHHHDGAFLYAFDLIELASEDLRRDPLVTRKPTS
jgi:ATP-dependent DNA ligase